MKIVKCEMLRMNGPKYTNFSTKYFDLAALSDEGHNRIIYKRSTVQTDAN